MVRKGQQELDRVLLALALLLIQELARHPHVFIVLLIYIATNAAGSTIMPFIVYCSFVFRVVDFIIDHLKKRSIRRPLDMIYICYELAPLAAIVKSILIFFLFSFILY